jgi:hypothetical protein
MSFTGALVVALIAIVAGAGCVGGTRIGEGQVLPPTAGSGIERCHGGGMYNQAAGFCVSGGP